MFGKMFGKTNEDLVQEKVYQDYSKDGAMVTLEGFLLVGIGLTLIFWLSIWNWMSPMSETLEFFSALIPLAVLMAVFLVVIRIWRFRITFPRLGYSKYVLKRNLPRKWMFRYFVLVMILDFVFLLVMKYSLTQSVGIEAMTKTYEDVAQIAAIGAGTTLPTFGFQLGIPRLIIVTVLMIALIWIMPFIGVSIGWAFVVIGLLIMWMGYQRLRSFLREFPLEVSADAC